MRTSSVGALVLLALMLALLLIGLRNRRAGREFLGYLRAAGFSPGPCPIAAPFTYTDMTQVDSYHGELRSGVPAHVVLGRRRGTSILVNGVPTANMEEYISLYLAPAPAAKLDDAWLQRWHADLDARGARPMRVVRTAEGGVLLTWRSAHEKSTLEARLSAVRQALP